MGRLILNPSIVLAAPWINSNMEGSKASEKMGVLCMTKSLNNILCGSVVARTGVTLNVAIANYFFKLLSYNSYLEWTRLQWTFVYCRMCKQDHIWLPEHVLIDYTELVYFAEHFNETIFDSLNMYLLIALNLCVAERFNETIFDSLNTYLLNICEVCGSSQCPYCPIYNLASVLPVPVTVILITCFIMVLRHFRSAYL